MRKNNPEKNKRAVTVQSVEKATGAPTLEENVEVDAYTAFMNEMEGLM